MIYILNIYKSNYTKYSLVSETKKIDLDNPSLIYGLFHLDVVSYDGDKIALVKRNLPKYISGELELYSKYSFKPNKRGVPTYIFRPIDNSYPKFLVSSTVKKTSTSNLMVTVEYQEWAKESLFPKANIVTILGSVYDKNPLQESLLYKYGVDNKNIKIDFKGISSKFKKLISDNKRYTVDREIISIDPPGCTDIDDAFSIELYNDVLNLQIHISDVYYLLSGLGLLDSVENISSVYLTESIKHMLPKVISSDLGSLIEDNYRFMITLFIDFNVKTGNIENIEFRETLGKITKNYHYKNYPKHIHRYFDYIGEIYRIVTKQKINIDDSHKFIEALMIVYNTQFAEAILSKTTTRVYRTQLYKDVDQTKIDNIDSSLEKFLTLISSNSAQYSIEKDSHTSLNIHSYTHVTSPLRRIVDLINQEVYYKDYSTLLDKITIDKINDTNKKLKKFYRDINKISLAYDVYNSESYMTNCYIYSFNIEKNNSYMYFPEENISIKLNIIHYKLYSVYNVSCKDSIITIESENDGSKKCIPLYKKLRVKINGKPDIYNIDKSIVVEILDNQ